MTHLTPPAPADAMHGVDVGGGRRGGGDAAPGVAAAGSGGGTPSASYSDVEATLEHQLAASIDLCAFLASVAPGVESALLVTKWTASTAQFVGRRSVRARLAPVRRLDLIVMHDANPAVRADALFAHFTDARTMPQLRDRRLSVGINVVGARDAWHDVDGAARLVPTDGGYAHVADRFDLVVVNNAFLAGNPDLLPYVQALCKDAAVIVRTNVPKFCGEETVDAAYFVANHPALTDLGQWLARVASPSHARFVELDVARRGLQFVRALSGQFAVCNDVMLRAMHRRVDVPRETTAQCMMRALAEHEAERHRQAGVPGGGGAAAPGAETRGAPPAPMDAAAARRRRGGKRHTKKRLGASGAGGGAADFADEHLSRQYVARHASTSSPAPYVTIRVPLRLAQLARTANDRRQPRMDIDAVRQFLQRSL